MSFSSSKVPTDSDLAIRVPEHGWHGYDRQVSGHQIDWAMTQMDTDELDHPMSYSMALVFQRRLFVTSLAHYEIENGDGRFKYDAEIVRRLALGTLAMSMLVKKTFDLDKVTLIDAVGHKNAQVGIDNFSDENYMPLDQALHLPSGYSDKFLPEPTESDEWFQDDESGLYVCRTRPASPSDQQITYAMSKGISVDFSRMESLYPYLPAAG